MDAIKEAIERLPREQQTVLADWLSERDWQAWDEQIERDFSPGGRGMPLLTELEREIADGKTRPMDGGFADRGKSLRGTAGRSPAPSGQAIRSLH